MADIVPDEAEVKERARQRHERFQRLTEGKSVRFKRRMDRVERTNMSEDIPKVRVLPKNDEFRKFLVHPLGNIGFRETGSVEWPLDQFTLRRIRDGDVTIDESHPQQPARPHQRPARAQSPAPATSPHQSEPKKP
jgi:hypothetical protein